MSSNLDSVCFLRDWLLIWRHKKSLTNVRLYLAVWTGLEPATPCVTGRYSNQLNYQTNDFI